MTQKPSDAVATLGTILPGDVGRDAVHVAVIAVQAGRRLAPGERVGRLGDGRYGPVAVGVLGVVDPFLSDEVGEGEWFWLHLFPRTITGLAHVWSHPSFPDQGGGS